MTTTDRKEIKFDRETRDYAMYLDGELVGYARTYHEAEVELNRIVFEQLSHGVMLARPADAEPTFSRGEVEALPFDLDAELSAEASASTTEIPLASEAKTCTHDELVRESTCRICHATFLVPALCLACEADVVISNEQPAPAKPRKVVQIKQFERLNWLNGFLEHIEPADVRSIVRHVSDEHDRGYIYELEYVVDVEAIQ